MGFMLNEVVPWGRSFEEYVALFNLTKVDLQKRILGCGDGPAAFNRELTRRGGSIVSVDPVYGFETEAIRDRIEATFDEVLDKVCQNQDEFVWEHITSPEELGQVRMAAMNTFLEDFDQGKQDFRYLAAELPDLPFPDDSFELALCSHFLFLYSPQLTQEFHRQAIAEMLRLAPEVRIFPLLELGSRPSRHLDGVMADLEHQGHQLEIETTPYEFQKGGNQLLRIVRG
jgi:SAM-dependent methyltransferase